jgi:para-aminobenzoate synthetase component 1
MEENGAWLLKEISTPYSAVEIYEKFHREKNSVFLDSGMEAGGLGRYSFIGRNPFLIFSVKGKRVTIDRLSVKEIKENVDPFKELKMLLTQFPMPRHPELPPLLGGAIGYFGYDLAYILEKLPEKSRDDLNIPDMYLGFYDTIVIVDQLLQKTWVASTGFPEQEAAKRGRRAAERLQEMETLLVAEHQSLYIGQPPAQQGNYTANYTPAQYCHLVQQAKEYIAAGDIFQVNLSQRLSGKLYEHPFQLYKRLRTVNPAPFASYLNFPDVTVASASPERYLLIRGKQVETRPIKGTRPRALDPVADAKMRAELWSSEKDRAELVMIIDLERNDLGRVCEYGSVQVPELIRMEEYATVFHLVSTVVGTLTTRCDALDALRASFPGGSISGAPKVRAMEIIDELEPVRRGIYTGSIGYIDFSGDADLNIVIRTFVIKDGMAHLQVGGGLVADSQPYMEYEETLHKAKALLNALGHH